MVRLPQIPESTRTLRSFVSFGLALLIAGFAGCGGGGGGGGSSSTAPPSGGTPPVTVTPTSVTGTAATGNPIAGATVVLHDSLGASATGVTGGSGTFTITTTGMTPPYIVQVPSGGSNLYSVSANASASTTINITPVTDLIIRSWYEAQGISIDTAFGAVTANPVPTASVVALLAQPVQGVFGLWLTQAGVPSGFNLISSAFSANGTGLDQVLDETKISAVSPTGSTITITNGTTTQTSTVADSSGTLTITTSTTAPSGTSGNFTTTVVPTTAAQLTVLNGIETALTSLETAVNNAGSALTTATVAPYIDASFLNDGLNMSQFETNIVSNFKGSTLAFSIQSIESINSTGTQAKVKLNTQQTASGQTQSDSTELYFINTSGAWFLYGNQRISDLEITSEMLTSQGAITSPNGSVVNVGAEAPTTTVSGVTLTGGGIFTATVLQPGAEDVNSIVNEDTFYTQSTVLSSLPAPGTSFSFSVTPATGPVKTYTVLSNGVTNEAVQFTGLSGSALSSANLGSSVTLTWTLPVTYTVAQIQVSALTFTGSQSSSTSSQCTTQSPVLSTSSATTTLNIPSTCNGSAVTSVNLNLSTIGQHGEQSQAIYVLGSP